MKLTEKQHLTLQSIFILLVLCLMLLTGCNKPILSKRQKTEDEKQLEFFKEQIKIRTHYLTLNNLNNIQK